VTLLVTAFATLAGAATAQAGVISATGSEVAAVTDHEGTTHVVWDESDQAAYDTVGYCRIPRGSDACADLRHLTPQCTSPDGGPGPIAIKHDRAIDGFSNGDGPHVSITPFGDVYITTHGVCPFDWRAASGDTPPWRSMTDIDQVIVFHSSDDGDSFASSESGDSRAFGGQSSPDHSTAGAKNSDASDTLYDQADNRLVTIEAVGNGSALYPMPSQSSSLGAYILGRFVPQKPGWLEGQQPWLASRLNTIIGNPAFPPPQIVQRGRGSFVASYPGARVGIRTFDCPDCALDDISDASRWSAEQQLPAEDGTAPMWPKIVTGPAGTFLLYQTSNNPVAGQPGRTAFRWWIRRIDGPGVGERHPVTDADPIISGGPGDVVQDPSNGRLIAVVTENHREGDAPADFYLDYTVSDDGGVTWTPLQVLKKTESQDHQSRPLLTAATGDDGFTGLLLEEERIENGHPYVTTNRGPIVATQLPGSGTTPPPPDDPGDPTTPPTGSGGGSTPPTATAPSTTPPPILSIPPAPSVTFPTDACKTLQYGPIDVKADACMRIDPKTGVATASGAVHVNGLRLAGAEIVFDPRKRTVDSDGPVDVSIGDTKLFELPIHWAFPKGNTFTLPGIDVGGTGGRLQGFPVKGSASIKFVRGAVEIPLHVALPKIFGEVTGDVTVRAENLSGLHLRDIRVKANLAEIGPLTLADLAFAYDPDTKSWSGRAKLTIPPKPPGPVLDSSIGFVQGDFAYLRNELTFPGEGIPLDTFDAVHLTKVRFSLEVQPDLKLSGGLTLTAGPKFGDIRAASIDGDFTFLLPDGRPAVLRADGRLQLLNIPVANAYLQYRTDGMITFGGQFGLDVLGVVQAHGRVDGWIMLPSTFSVTGDVEACIADFACKGGSVGVSTKGIAVCARIAGVSVGAGYEWGPSILWAPSWIADIDLMLSGCDVGDYVIDKPAGARAAQAGADRTVAIGDGLPFTVIRVVGTQAAPRVTLVGPDGTRVDATAAEATESGATAVAHVPAKNETFVIVKRPAAGAWRVEPAPGSSPIAEVGHADGLPQPSVRARLTGRGRSHVLHYDITPVDGQRVRFEERAPGLKAARSLGYAKGERGTIRFSPASGPAGRRIIVAQVESFGTPRRSIAVASYTAPAPPHPARPRGLTVTHRGTRLAIAWKPLRSVARYRIIVTLSDGRTLLLLPSARARRAGVRGVGRRVTATVSLRGQRGDGTLGPAATVTRR
jgi:hypothetical protein